MELILLHLALRISADYSFGAHFRYNAVPHNDELPVSADDNNISAARYLPVSLSQLEEAGDANNISPAERHSRLCNMRHHFWNAPDCCCHLRDRRRHVSIRSLGRAVDSVALPEVEN